MLQQPVVGLWVEKQCRRVIIHCFSQQGNWGASESHSRLKTQKNHYFYIVHNWTVEFVTMWFGGDKRFGSLPKAIRKHYGREMQCLVITAMQKRLRLVTPPSFSPWKGQFRPFLHHSAVADRCCVRTQEHNKNQFDSFHVSYAGFKARSFVDWEDFGLLLIFNLSSKMTKKNEERRDSICMKDLLSSFAMEQCGKPFSSALSLWNNICVTMESVWWRFL